MSKSINDLNMGIIQQLIDHYGLTKTQFAHKLNLSETTVENWCNSRSTPTYKQLIRIAEFFKKPLVFFYLENPPIISSKVDFRKSPEFQNIPDKKRFNELLDSILIYKLGLEEIIGSPSSLINSWSAKFKEFKKNEFFEFLRQELNFTFALQTSFITPAEVIEYLREEFYKCGIYIFKDSFRIPEISGLCLYDNSYPLILINNKISFTRQLFTIFHELYHLLSADSYIDLVEACERDCDRFAGEFLIPETELLEDISRCHIDYNRQNCEVKNFIDKMAQKYNISREAYIYQLKRQNEVGDKFYREYIKDCMQYLIRTRQDDISGGNYYYTKMNYLGRSYLNDVVKNYFIGNITIRNVSQFTQMKVPHAKRMISMMAGGRY